MGRFSCLWVKGVDFQWRRGMAKKNRQPGCRAPQFFLLKIFKAKREFGQREIARKSGDAELFPPEFL